MKIFNWIDIRSMPREGVYRWSVIWVALIVLIVGTYLTTTNLRLPIHLFIFTVLVALQTQLLFERDGIRLGLYPVTTLAAAVVFGPVQAGWGVLAGFGLGYLLAKYGSGWLRRFQFTPATDFSELAFASSAHNLALMALLFLPGWQPFVDQAGWMALGFLLFSGIHLGLLYLVVVLRLGKLAVWDRRQTIANISLVVSPTLYAYCVMLLDSRPGWSWWALTGLLPVGAGVMLRAALGTRLDYERRVSELATLNRISLALRASLDLESLLEAFHQQTRNLLQVDNFYVALYDAEHKRLSYPLAVKAGKREKWPPRALMNRWTDRVIKTQQPLLMLPGLESDSPSGVADTEDDSAGPFAWMGVPLIASDRILGCLAAFSTSPHVQLSQADLEVFVTLSGQAGVAIENVVLLEQAQRRATQLETLNRISALITASLDPEDVLAKVCDSVTQLSSARSSAIYLLEMDQSRVWLAWGGQLSDTYIQKNQTIPLGHAVRTRCLRTGNPEIVPDIKLVDVEAEVSVAMEQEGIRAWGNFPLVTPEGQIGFLAVYFAKPHHFDPAEIELLQTLAAQAALSVSNARLYARTDMALSRRAYQLSILEAVGRELAAELHSDRLFQLILDYAMEYTNSVWGSIGMFDAVQQEISIMAVRGYPADFSHLGLNEGASWRAILSSQTIVIPDVTEDPDYLDLSDGAARSQISIPLIHENRVLGVLTLESAVVDAYDRSDQAFVEQLGTQAAIALLNAELYADSQRRLREQSTLFLVSRNLVGNLQIENILNTIGRALHAGLDIEALGIYLWDETHQGYVLQPKALKSLPVSTCLLPQAPADLWGHWETGSAESGLFVLSSRMVNLEEIFPRCENGQVVGLLLGQAEPRVGLVLIHLDDEAPLSPETIQLLQTIASQGSLALQNAQLFADVIHGRDRLAAVLNTVGEGIILVETSGSIGLVNAAFQTIADHSLENFSGLSLGNLPRWMQTSLGLSHQEAVQVATNLRSGLPVNLAKKVIHLPFTSPERIVERSSAVVQGRSGRINGLLLVIRDITEEYRISQERELITETLVHDLRSPVTAVHGALDILGESLEADPQSRDRQTLDVAQRGTRRVLNLIESLLDISRLQSGEMEATLTSVNLYRLTEEVLAEFAHQAQQDGIELRSEVSPNLPRVRVDKGKVTRVLANLVDNALKFSPSGREVIIQARSEPEGMLTVQVYDQGPGVPEAYRERIFERFGQIPGQRARRRGSGLGLTFCRLAVEAHGGSIWVSAPPEGGSVFAFTLPTIP